jgi:hypothetical protein
MKESQTYFEQVPKAVVEKIRAQQDAQPGSEPEGDEVVAKAAADETEEATAASPQE